MQFERSMIGAVDDSEIVMFARARLGKPQSAQCLQHELCECVLIDGPGIGDLLGRRFPGRLPDAGLGLRLRAPDGRLLPVRRGTGREVLALLLMFLYCLGGTTPTPRSPGIVDPLPAFPETFALSTHASTRTSRYV